MGLGVTPISVASLSRIRNPKILQIEAETPTKEEQRVIERLLANGIEFYPEKVNPPLIKVRLSKEAQDLFNHRAVNRPFPISIEKDVYTFDCSFYQFRIYFLGFLPSFEILEPQEIKDIFLSFYESKISSLSR